MLSDCESANIESLRQFHNNLVSCCEKKGWLERERGRRDSRPFLCRDEQVLRWYAAGRENVSVACKGRQCSREWEDKEVYPVSSQEFLSILSAELHGVAPLHVGIAKGAIIFGPFSHWSV